MPDMRDSTRRWDIHLSWYETHNGHPHLFGRTLESPTLHVAWDNYRWHVAHPESWMPAGGFNPEVSEPPAVDDEPADPETVAAQLEQMRQMLAGAEAKRKAKWGR